MRWQWLILVLVACAGPATAANEPNQCVVDREEPSSDIRVRPTLWLACGYDAGEFNRRLLSLLRNPNRALSVEAVERAFALPQLRTSYDHPRTARYDVVLTAAREHGSWRVMLSFEESFFPLDAWRRPRFRGNGRPVLITPRRHGEKRLHLAWLASREISFGTPVCLRIEPLESELGRYGWRGSLQPVMVMDAPSYLAFTLRRGRSQISIDFNDETGCVDDFTLGRPADLGSN